jgi:hypothetical protein
LLAGGLLWIAALVLLGIVNVLLPSGPATAENPCPSCKPPIPILTTAALVGGTVSLIMISGGVGILRFFLVQTRAMKLGMTLVLTGILLLAAYGLGILLVLPGLTLLCFHIDRDQGWSSLAPSMLVVGSVGLLIPFFLVNRPIGLLGGVLIFGLPSLFGLGWIQFSMQLWRHRKPGKS